MVLFYLFLFENIYCGVHWKWRYAPSYYQQHTFYWRKKKNRYQCILTTYLDYELPTIKLSPKLRQNRFKVQCNETQNSQCKFAMCLALSIRYLNSFSMYISVNSEITEKNAFSTFHFTLFTTRDVLLS